MTGSAVVSLCCSLESGLSSFVGAWASSTFVGAASVSSAGFSSGAFTSFSSFFSEAGAVEETRSTTRRLFVMPDSSAAGRA